MILTQTCVGCISCSLRMSPFLFADRLCDLRIPHVRILWFSRLLHDSVLNFSVGMLLTFVCCIPFSI